MVIPCLCLSGMSMIFMYDGVYNKRAVWFCIGQLFYLRLCKLYYAFLQYSSETVSFLRPCARRDASTRRPLAVAILSRKPCLFFLFLLEGWNVLFIVIQCFICLFSRFADYARIVQTSCCLRTQRYVFFFRLQNFRKLSLFTWMMPVWKWRMAVVLALYWGHGCWKAGLLHCTADFCGLLVKKLYLCTAGMD